jgi:hypothetical protein
VRHDDKQVRAVLDQRELLWCDTDLFDRDQNVHGLHDGISMRDRGLHPSGVL